MEQDVIAILQGQPRFEGLHEFSSLHEEDFLNSFAEAPSTLFETSVGTFQGGVSPIMTINK